MISKLPILSILTFIVAFWISPNSQEKKKIIFFGDSITAGYGISLEEPYSEKDRFFGAEL